MVLWQFFGIIALIALILEVVMPTFFFLNFALAGAITAIASLFVTKFIYLVGIFVGLSLLSILLLRPIFLKEPKAKTNFDSEYKDKIVKVVENITSDSGVITIYGETWQARLEHPEDGQIDSGCDVRIVRNDSLILFVERV